MKTLTKIALCLMCLQLVSCGGITADQRLRVATFNIAMGLHNEGELIARLESGEDPGLMNFAAILQTVRPDIVLINEIDFEPRSAMLLQENYLSRSQHGHATIDYPYSWSSPVNTGVDSGLDLDGDGATGSPNDAWGFGRFAGQYGMLVLSMHPIEDQQLRTFRHFLWKDMPGAARPVLENGEGYYPEPVWDQLRLSSKSHWDIPILVGKRRLHVLASHPTPPVFDGIEDRNGRRNHDEIRLWADYISSDQSFYLYDDNGKRGGLPAGSRFIIAGDQNSDPHDGDSFANAIRQLTGHPLIASTCIPASSGAVSASKLQGGTNAGQAGDPAHDTADFSDALTGNLRIDYVLPSKNLKVSGCGVFWPAEGEAGAQLVNFTDHRLVWIDIKL